MKPCRCTSLAAAVLFLTPHAPARAADGERVADIQAAFQRQSGTRLVFDASDLPPGRYHDAMPSLSDEGKTRAARIALREVGKLPPGYLGKVGLKAIGVFAACLSERDDGFHRYDDRLKGYRYYGVWNGKDGVAVACYGDEQLPLTLHHEIFHHVDAAAHARLGPAAAAERDEAFRKVEAGDVVYAAPKVSPEDRAALEKCAKGAVLEGAVSAYCKKSPGEDKAETARYLMSDLPDALLQMISRPELPGSQRLLYVLAGYEQASSEGGAGFAWFLDEALGRRPAAERSRPADLLARLRAAARPGDLGDRAEEARQALRELERLSPEDITADEAGELVAAAAEVTHAVMRLRLRPREDDTVFTVWGTGGPDGGNQTLRSDLAGVGDDVRRLKRIAAIAPAKAGAVADADLRDLRLLARYYIYIRSHWGVSASTRRAFEAARDDLLAALPAGEAKLAASLAKLDWDALGQAAEAGPRGP